MISRVGQPWNENMSTPLPTPPPFEVRVRPVFTFKDKTGGSAIQQVLTQFVQDPSAIVNIAAQTMLAGRSKSTILVKLVVGPPNPDDETSLELQVARAKQVFRGLGIKVSQDSILQVLNPAQITATPGVLGMFFNKLWCRVRVIASITGEAVSDETAESAYWQVPEKHIPLAIQILENPQKFSLCNGRQRC